jgi:hypothetical protein
MWSRPCAPPAQEATASHLVNSLHPLIGFRTPIEALLRWFQQMRWLRVSYVPWQCFRWLGWCAAPWWNPTPMLAHRGTATTDQRGFHEYMSKQITTVWTLRSFQPAFFCLRRGELKCVIIGWVCDRCGHQVVVPNAFDFVEFWDCVLHCWIHDMVFDPWPKITSHDSIANGTLSLNAI